MERYGELFDKLDTAIVHAFEEASNYNDVEMFKFTLHTLVSGAKANIYRQITYNKS